MAKSYKELNLGHTLLIEFTDKTPVIYMLYKDKKHLVDKQMYNLPKGSKLKYPDGAYMIHSDDYCLLRHWHMPNGEIVDRVAIPWNNLYCEV